jgi:hypothetical protein
MHKISGMLVNEIQRQDGGGESAADYEQENDQPSYMDMMSWYDT